MSETYELWQGVDFTREGEFVDLHFTIATLIERNKLLTRLEGYYEQA